MEFSLEMFLHTYALHNKLLVRTASSLFKRTESLFLPKSGEPAIVFSRN